MQYGFYFDASRCTSCKTCTLACKDYNNLSETIAFRNVIEYAGGSWTMNDNGSWENDAYCYNISIACNHCDMPACVANCPTGAMTKDPETGLVSSDHEVCIGCGTCVNSCPYGAPSVDKELGYSVKCVMCSERLEAGMKPICVAACSTRALDFGDIEELRAKYGTLNEMAPLEPASTTGPNIIFKAPANMKSVGDTTGSIINTMDLVLGM